MKEFLTQFNFLFYCQPLYLSLQLRFLRGKDFERGWHDVHLRTSEKEELYIGIFQDAKVCYKLLFKYVFYFKKDYYYFYIKEYAKLTGNIMPLGIVNSSCFIWLTILMDGCSRHYRAFL